MHKIIHFTLPFLREIAIIKIWIYVGKCINLTEKRFILTENELILRISDLIEINRLIG